MKAFVRHIGIVDKANTAHAVTFKPGLNVVTGKSSTGKSALIEIFDYCFGSSDFTVPDGVITESAVIYFVVMRLKDKNLVLARKGMESRAFIKEEDDTAVTDCGAFKEAYFGSDYFLPLSDFKKSWGASSDCR
jgi:DNA repair ATPase RecN